MLNAITIRWLIAAAAVCAALSITAAQANDTVTFRDVLKPNGHERAKREKFADAHACGASGRAHTIRTTMPVFENCMRAKGWVLDHYAPDPSVSVRGTLLHYIDTVGDARGRPRGTPELHADTRACKWLGSVSIKQCLAERGWQHIYTQHGPAPRQPAYTPPDPTWIDPETGLRCHNESIATVCS